MSSNNTTSSGKDNYLTIVTTNKPCNKQVRLENGEPVKSHKGVIFDGQCETVHVPDVDAMAELLKRISGDPRAALINGYAEGPTNYRLLSRKAIEKAIGEPYRDGWHDIDGVPTIARTKNNFKPSAWWQLDRDVVNGMPAELNPADEQDFEAMLDSIWEGFNEAAFVCLPSTTGRVLIDGKPMKATGSRYWVQVKKASGMEGFGNRLKFQAAANGLGFMKVHKTGAKVLWAIVDCSVFSPERIIFDGAPDIGRNKRITLAPFECVIQDGNKLDSRLVKELTDEQLEFVQDKFSVAISLSEGGARDTIIDTDGLTLDTLIETAKYGTVSVKEFMEADLAIGEDRWRCQVEFRDSRSMNGALRKDIHGVPYLQDFGFNTKYCLANSVVEEIRAKEAQLTTAKTQAALASLLKPASEDYPDEDRQREIEVSAIFSDEMAKIEAAISDYVATSLGTDDLSDIGFNAECYINLVAKTFWNPTRSVFCVVREDGFIELKEREFLTHMDRAGKRLIDRGAVNRICALHAETPAQARTMTNSVCKGITARVVTYVMEKRQRPRLSQRVDMFASKSYIDIDHDCVNIIYPHRPYAARHRRPNPKAVADYIDHFPAFIKTLDFITASRFLRDRKNTFLWLHADSNWGKGFFMSLFADMGAVVKMSVKEIEKAGEGAAVGRSAGDFLRAIVLAVDEFKSARSEMKELQSHIQIAPKFQMLQTAELYTKLFMSAESVRSFAGENGIEDQYATRFSYIRGLGSLEDRPLFNKLSKASYFDAIQTYLVDRLNSQIAEYVALGKLGSEERAERVIEAYRDEFAIDNEFKRFSSMVEDWATEFVQFVYDAYKRKDRSLASSSSLEGQVMAKLTEYKGDLYLAHSSRLVDEWIGDTFDRSTKVSISFKNTDIVSAISEDKKGTVLTRLGGQVGRFCKLNLALIGVTADSYKAVTPNDCNSYNDNKEAISKITSIKSRSTK